MVFVMVFLIDFLFEHIEIRYNNRFINVKNKYKYLRDIYGEVGPVSVEFF